MAAPHPLETPWEEYKSCAADIVARITAILGRYADEEKSPETFLARIKLAFEQHKFLTKDGLDVLARIEKLKDIVAASKELKNLKPHETLLKDLAELADKDENMRQGLTGSETNNEGLLTLGVRNKNEHVESIRVYLIDATSKSFMVSVSETTSELIQRIIGKLSQLDKDFSRGCALFEIPYSKKDPERKLALDECPALTKRNWKRPARFFFFTAPEEEQHRVNQTPESSPTIERRATSPTGTAPASAAARALKLAEPAPKVRSSSVSNGNAPRKSGGTVQVLLEDGTSKEFTITPGETFSAFRRRSLDKLHNLVNNEVAQLNIAVTDTDGVERAVSDFELMSKLLADQTLAFKVKRKKIAIPVEKSIEALKDKTSAKFTFAGFQSTAVPVEFGELVSVAKSIDLSNNAFTSLPPYFDAFSELQILNLSSNSFAKIPVLLGKLVALQVLDISGNGLARFPEELCQLVKLKSLFLSSNALSELPAALAKLVRLEELTCAGNHIVALPDTFTALSALRMIDISTNKFKALPPFLTKSTLLEELYAASNEIAALPTDLYSVASLRTLDLSQNKIPKIPDGIAGLTALDDLLLQGNPIDYTPIEEIKQLPHLHRVEIPGIDIQEQVVQIRNQKLQRRVTAQSISLSDLLLNARAEESGALQSPSSSSDPNCSPSSESMIRKSLSAPDVEPMLPSLVEGSEESSGSESSDTKSTEKARVDEKRKRYAKRTLTMSRSVGAGLGGRRVAKDEDKADAPDHKLIVTKAKGYKADWGQNSGEKLNPMDNFSLMNLRLKYNLDDYYTNFHGLSHVNFLCVDKNLGPTVVSVLMEKEKHKRSDYYRVLVKCMTGDTTLWIPCELVNTISKKSKSAIEEKVRKVVKKELRSANFEVSSLRPIREPEFIDDVLDYETRMHNNAFKFGVIFMGKDQKSEDEWYSNKTAPAEFDEFLEFLGDKIALKGWTNYSAGLDTVADRTGQFGIYRRWSSTEIMFHVSTFLPYKDDDEQQIERKKHIGNDIVVLIYQEEGAPPFDPRWVKSWFNHVFIVVRSVSAQPRQYQIAVAHKEGVKEITPLLPQNPVFEKNAAFRRFLLTKLINGERASYFAPNFAKALNRTRLQLLQMLAQKWSTKKKKAK